MNSLDSQSSEGSSSMGYDTAAYSTSKSGESHASMNIQTSHFLPDTHMDPQSPQISRISSSVTHQSTPPYHSRSDSDTSHSSSSRTNSEYHDHQHLNNQQQRSSDVLEQDLTTGRSLQGSGQNMLGIHFSQGPPKNLQERIITDRQNKGNLVSSF
jgi:hypothetical protein